MTDITVDTTQVVLAGDKLVPSGTGWGVDSLRAHLVVHVILHFGWAHHRRVRFVVIVFRYLKKKDFHYDFYYYKFGEIFCRLKKLYLVCSNS